MDNGWIVEIRQVANGYIVMPANTYRDPGSRSESAYMYVFQTFAELSAWLTDHFTHRTGVVAADSVSSD
jgi:hypothetical protein